VSSKYIAASILAALEHRRRTGEGQYIDLSQVEASLHFLGPALLDYTVNGHVEHRAGNFDRHHAPHGVYRCAGEDPGAPGTGRWAAIACATEEQWQALCRVAGQGWEQDEGFATFAARLANREELDAAIAEWTAGRTEDELEEMLQAAGVPVHRASSSADLIADPQLAARGHLPTVEHPELGPVQVESSRMLFSRTPARVAWPGPTYGQHNERVLKEILGMSDEEITELLIAGALE
jgi:crotonobetainyl-CoA:carnitine CoA-transferase CaiB-like acyl-CoA transferase